MRIAYKYRLYPNREQRKLIDFTLERCHLLYNRLLAERIHAYRNEGKSISYYDQANTLNDRKVAIPGLKLVYSQVLQDVARRLEKSFLAFYSRVKQGEKPGFPRFKSSSQYDSFTYPQKGYKLEHKKLELSKIGKVKIKLHRMLQGKIKTCTILRKNRKYYVSFSCEVERETLPVSEKSVGIDLGLKTTIVTSDGEFFSTSRHSHKAQAQICKLQRAVSRKERGSNRRKKAVLLLAKKYEHIANQRKEQAHQISRQLVERYGLIAFEDLRIVKMIQNPNFAQKIADAGWGQLVAFTKYKAESAGRVFIQVDPYHTSQKCSSCGKIVKKDLNVRVHNCPHCGYVGDRDENAAINILKLALEVS